MAKHDPKKEGAKMNRKTISYDDENDILFIHKGFESDERFKGNIDVGDLVLDMSTKGRVKGLEILNATRFLKDFDIRKDTLTGLTAADFEANTRKDSIVISLFLKAKQEAHAKIAIPIGN